MRGGILVEEGPQQHAWAVQRTQELTANPVIRAIFEAFAFDRILIRAAPMAGIRPIPDETNKQNCQEVNKFPRISHFRVGLY